MIVLYLCTEFLLLLLFLIPLSHILFWQQQATASEHQRQSQQPCLLVAMDTATRRCAIIRVDMTTTEQLNFTVWPADHQDSLSTSYPSRPPPLILDGNCTDRTAMGERLALAVRLARRDLQRSLAHRTMLEPQQV